MERSKKGPGGGPPSPNSHDAERLGSFREPQPSCIQKPKADWRIDLSQTTSGLGSANGAAEAQHQKYKV
jgi:hypothetical protein